MVAMMSIQTRVEDITGWLARGIPTRALNGIAPHL